MQFEGEHLWIGQVGHIFVLIAFTASLLSTIAFFRAGRILDSVDKLSWLRFARISFLIQSVAVFIVFSSIFYICSHHYLEYLFGYKHTSKELEFKYLFASIWEDQSGSFLLWSIWHSVIGMFLIWKSKEWEAPVMTVVSLAQLFLAMMIKRSDVFSLNAFNEKLPKVRIISKLFSVSSCTKSFSFNA